MDFFGTTEGGGSGGGGGNGGVYGDGMLVECDYWNSNGTYYFDFLLYAGATGFAIFRMNPEFEEEYVLWDYIWNVTDGFVIKDIKDKTKITIEFIG